MRFKLSVLMDCALLLLLFVAFGIGDAAREEEEGAAANSTSTPWLDERRRTRRHGCWRRPWICYERLPPPFERRMCCGNQCVDVGSDVNNCGLCGARCPFRWRCCNGLCVDVMVNPDHCGSCANRCPSGFRCLYGLCGYAAAPLPPSPCP